MANKYCKKCNMVLNSDVKFCPECGGAVEKLKKRNDPTKSSSKFSFDKKKLIIIGLIAVGVIIVAIVAFAIIQNLVLKNNANNAKNNVNNKAEIEIVSENIGNLACNICAEAYTVNDGEHIYFAANDGIYKSKNLDEAKYDKDNSKKIADGKFTALNYFDGNIFCIKTDDNSVYKLSDLNNGDKLPYIDKIYTADSGFTLVNTAINSENIYTLSNASGTYYLTSTNLRSKSKINDVWHGEGTNAWMFLNDSTLRVCVSGASGWTAYKGSIDGNKTAGLEKYCSGSGNPVSVAFFEDKVYALSAGALSNSSNISVSDVGGNRSDVNLDCAAKKILLSGETVFAQCANDHYIWFNIDTNMSHDIDNNDFKDVSVKTINVNNGKFCVLYSDDSVVLSDIASLN